MKQAWHPDELTQYWTLSDDECRLLGEKTGATRLAFAVLLKAFQYEGRFPLRRDTVPMPVIGHIAAQVAVPVATVPTSVPTAGTTCSRSHTRRTLSPG